MYVRICEVGILVPMSVLCWSISIISQVKAMSFPFYFDSHFQLILLLGYACSRCKVVSQKWYSDLC